METHLVTPLKALEYAKTRLGAMPSDGLLQLLAELIDIGLPVKVFDQLGLSSGSATVRRDGIELRLADGPFTEGVLAHEAVSAILETRGWPRLFGEAKASGARHYLERLVNLLDHAAGIALQRDFAVDGEPYEAAQVTAQWRRIVQLNRQENLANGLSDSDRIGYSLDIALTAIDQRWRMGSLPVPYVQVMQTFPDARQLYDQMMQAAAFTVPRTGWDARRVTKALIDIIDAYLERTTGGRPLNLAAQFVPSLHQEDGERTVSEVATIIETPLDGGGSGVAYDIRIVNQRDGLGFSFDESFVSAAIAQKQLEAIGNETYAPFIRAKVPNAVLIFRPTGE